MSESEAVTEKVLVKTCFERNKTKKGAEHPGKKLESAERDENKYTQPTDQRSEEYLPQARSCVRSTGIKRDKCDR